MTQALIIYEGLHGLGRGDMHALHRGFGAFMDLYGRQASPDQAYVVLDMRSDDDPVLALAHEELAAAYGRYPKKLTGSGPGGREWRTFLWQLAPGALDGAFARAAELQSRGGLLQERTTIKLTWEFRLRDPDTRQPLAGQDTMPRIQSWPGGKGELSSVVLNLGRPSSSSLWLMFPFAEPDDAFRAYVARLRESLPVKLAPDKWRRWRLTKAGSWKAEKLVVE